MTIAKRLLVALSVLTAIATGTLAIAVRTAWRTMAEDQFAERFSHALAGLRTELDAEKRDVPRLLGELCEHDPLFDGALVDARGGQLDPGRRLSISLQVPELMKAVRLSELTLVTSGGEILGAADSGRVGSRSPELAAKLREPSNIAVLRTGAGTEAIEAHCARTYQGTTLGLVGARRLDAVLARVSAAQGLSLSFERPKDVRAVLVASVDLPELPGRPLHATVSRAPLDDALARLDRTLVGIGAATIGAALVLALLVARGLARPIAELATQARNVVTGEPVPVVTSGATELRELAASFNQTIADLVALRKRLAATERIAARREIARRVAHEIKNPLAPIRAAVETLRRLRARSDPAFDEYFDEATRTVLLEVQRITQIVQEFTRFARLPPPNPTEMDLATAVRDVVTLHSAGGVPVSFDAAELPRIVADRDQLVQVTTNLVQNALDAVSGRPSPRVSVRLDQPDPAHVRLVVEDDGPGVPKEMRGRLFEPYATTKEHGTGLGLAIVERIVVEHGGEITHHDVPGGGAEFRVVLPVRGPTLLPDAPPESAPGTERAES
ncbi:MAG TPA: ATP-binding protein [Polyangiaceae bacterium]|nr:ATP-binding protein [Polyangiaceae bacterium]